MAAVSWIECTDRICQTCFFPSASNNWTAPVGFLLFSTAAAGVLTRSGRCWWPRRQNWKNHVIWSHSQQRRLCFEKRQTVQSRLKQRHADRMRGSIMSSKHSALRWNCGPWNPWTTRTHTVVLIICICMCFSRAQPPDSYQSRAAQHGRRSDRWGEAVQA